MEGFDRDLGFNGDLLYVISDGDYDSAFKLDTLTGELFVDGPLDREKTSDYLLNITVQDQGSPRPKFVSKLLHVRSHILKTVELFIIVKKSHFHSNFQVIVIDANDNAPQFLKSTFSPCRSIYSISSSIVVVS